MRIVIGAERLRADPLFDPQWYRWKNPDAPRSARAAARHYAVVGVEEFHSPSPDFSAERYAARHPDVASSGLSPLVHYVRFGRREGRPTWAHYERFFVDADGLLDRDALETFLRSGALIEGRGSVLRAMPHLLHGMPRGKTRAFGDILVALANEREVDLGPLLSTGPAQGSLDRVSVSIVGEPGILATATLAALLVGAEVGRGQIGAVGEPTPDGDVIVEVQAGALVLPGSLRWLVLHARRGSGQVAGIALQADGAPAQSWTDDEAPPVAILTAALADAAVTAAPRVVRGAAAVWWPREAPPLARSASVAATSGPVGQRRRVLVMDASIPTPDLDSGSLSSTSHMRTLAALGFRVVFVPQDLRYHPRYTEELEAWGVEVVDERYVDSIEQVLAAVPFALAELIRPSVFTWAIDRINDVQPSLPVIFTPLDLHHVRLAAEATLSGDASLALAAERVRLEELAAIARSAATIVVSSAEVHRVEQLSPAARVALVPMARERSAGTSIRDWSGRHDLIFLGSYPHPPNLDGLLWFLDEVWPSVAERVADARFVAYGSAMPPELDARASDRVTMHGYVENLGDAFATARIGVVPLRFGAGAKGKVTTTMLAGVPIVSTSVGTEGMDIEESAIVVADGAPALADAIVELWRDEPRLSGLSARALNDASTRFSLEAQRTAMAALLESLGLVSR